MTTKKTGGAPGKSPREKRIRLVMFRVSDADYLSLKRKAGRDGVNAIARRLVYDFLDRQDGTNHV